jgi:hypothetical protein
LDSDGYLYAPSDRYAALFPEKRLLSVSDLVKNPWFAILGEPGIGKSTVLRDLHSHTTDLLAGTSDTCGSLINLGNYSQEERFIKEVFESPEMLEWKVSNYRLYLFLDSFDEALIRIDTLRGILVNQLNRIPRERLFLRLSCRTASWSSFLESELNRLWQECEFNSPLSSVNESGSQGKAQKPSKDRADSENLCTSNAYELLPLRRVDIEIAASTVGVDASKFLTEVDEKRIVPLAAIPMTLELMLRQMKANHTLPGTRWELYVEGILHLCSENNEERDTPRLRGILSHQQRMEIAGHIAFIMLMCNKNAIYSASRRELLSENELAVNDLLKSSEFVDGREVSFPLASVQEVLGSTALFSSRGQDCLGWSHQTFMEFLAAWYIEKIRLPDEQLLNLLLGKDQHAIPQLSSLIVWIIARRDFILNAIMESDPEIVVLADQHPVSSDFSQRLVDSLIERKRENQDYYTKFEIRRSYPMLIHPGLGTQLSRYIADCSEDRIVRDLAMDIGAACRPEGLRDALVNLILNPTEDSGLRHNAVWVLGFTDDAVGLKRIGDFALQQLELEGDDRLRGALLIALWPSTLDLNAILSRVKLPHHDGHSHDLHYFFNNTLPSRARKEELLQIIRWTFTQKVQRHDADFFRGLYGGIVKNALSHLSDSSFRSEIVGFLLWLYENCPHFLELFDRVTCNEMLRCDPQQRRALLRDFLLACDEKTYKYSHFVRSEIALYIEDDQSWLLEELPKIQLEARERWLTFSRSTYDINQVATLEELLNLSKLYPEVADAFRYDLMSVDLDSEQARKLRAQWQSGLPYRAREKRERISPTPIERITEALDEFEKGKIECWCQLSSDLRLSEFGKYEFDWWKPDIREFPVWDKCSTDLKTRICAAAVIYLERYELDLEKWVERQTFSQAEYAYYQALVLCFREDRSKLDFLATEATAKCAGLALYVSNDSSGYEAELGAELREHFYCRTPSDVLYWASKLMHRELTNNQVFVTYKLESLWDESVSKLVLWFSKNTRFSQRVRGILLRQVLSHGYEKAFTYSRELVLNHLNLNGKGIGRNFRRGLVGRRRRPRRTGRVSERIERVMAAHALGGLMLHSVDSEWEIVEKALSKDQIIATRALEIYIYSRVDRDLANYGRKLTLAQAKTLFTLLAGAYPHSDDPEIGEVTTRREIARFRDSLITTIVNMGTAESVSTLIQIRREFPTVEWLADSIVRARELARRKSWTPPTPSELRRLLADPKGRRIVSEGQLFQLVLDNLAKFEQELRGPSAKIRRLWNEKPCMPKNESMLANELRIFLQENLSGSKVTVNREVEIHSFSANSGDYPDILVEAIGEGGTNEPKIGVVIEVKGNWHRELHTSLKTQLVDRYLNNNPCTHGLYVVGFFSCNAWENEYRRSDARTNGDLETLNAFLDGQATEANMLGFTIRAVVLDCRIPDVQKHVQRGVKKDSNGRRRDKQ